MTRTSFVALVLAIAVDAGAAPAGRPKRIQWQKDFTTALEKAKAEKKPVMIDFWADWCGWCRKLDAVTYKDAEVVALTADFVSVKVDTEGRRTEQKVAADYGVESLPTIAFLSPEGRLISRIQGFQPPEQFRKVLKGVRATSGELMGLESAAAAGDAAALAALGQLMFEKESYEDSRSLLARAAAVDAQRPVKERKRTRTILGIIQHFDNKPAEAQRVLKEALDLKPADADEDSAALLTLGKSYLKSGKTEDARSTLKKVVNAYPQSRSAVHAREALEVLPQ